MAKKPSTRKLTRNDQRNLDVEISFIEGVVRRDPGYVDALQILGDDYTRRGRFTDGLTVDEQLARLRPQDPTVLYNLACSYALTDRSEEAFAVLERALAAGYKDAAWMSRDPDLEKIRHDPRFADIQKAAKAKAKSS